MKKTILLFGVFLASYTFAQVGISPVSTDTPQATLDVKAMTTTGNAVEGILIPRVDRAKAGSMTAANIQTSTMIYVNSIANGAASGITADVDAVGFYYYDGTKWVKIGATGSLASVSTGPTYTAQASDDYIVNSTGAALTINLAALQTTGKQVCVYQKDAGSIAFSVNNMKGQAVTFASNSGGCYIFDGTHWLGVFNY